MSPDNKSLPSRDARLCGPQNMPAISRDVFQGLSRGKLSRVAEHTLRHPSPSSRHSSPSKDTVCSNILPSRVSAKIYSDSPRGRTVSELGLSSLASGISQENDFHENTPCYTEYQGGN